MQTALNVQQLEQPVEPSIGARARKHTIRLTTDQSSQLKEATGREFAELKIESPNEQISDGACTGWIYGPKSEQTAWVFKPLSGEAGHPEPHIDPRHACFRLAVAGSVIDRFGVFADEAIPDGSDVMEYTGERVNLFEAHLRMKRSERLYIIQIDSVWKLDGAKGGSGAELINHGCDPNVSFVSRAGRIFVQSLRNIESGEELTADYGLSKDAPPVSCRCGSHNCRGTINRVDL